MTVTALVYLVVYFTCLGRALLYRPVWGVYAYFFCFYLHAPSQWWGQSLPDLRWSLLASVVTLVALLIRPPVQGFRFWRFRENRWLTLLAIFVLAQFGFALSVYTQTEYAELLLKFLLFIFLFQNTVHTLSDIKGVLWVNALGAAYLAYLGITTHTGGRLEGVGTPGMESANQLGQHFALVLLMCSYMLLERLHWLHALLAACLGLILIALFMTESRGVIASLAATALLAAWFVPAGRRVKVTFLGGLALLAGAALMGPQIVERFSGMSKDETGEMVDESAESRFVILSAQWEMFKKSPWVGYGHRGTVLLSPIYIPEENLTNGGNSDGPSVRASHNVAAAFLVDHGVIGAGFYFIAVICCGWRLFAVKSAVPYLRPSEQEIYRIHAGLLAGCILALASFMMGGMGSNNKKLEGDIWVMALAPVIHARMRRMQLKNRVLAERQVQSEGMLYETQ